MLDEQGNEGRKTIFGEESVEVIVNKSDKAFYGKKILLIELGTVTFGLLLVFQTAFAQTNSAVLQVTVTDPTGARVPEATVVLESGAPAFRREVSANPNGSFVFTNLNPRTYSVTVSKDGFQTWFAESLVLNAADFKDLKVSLVLGRAEEQVTVTAPLTDLSTAIATNIDQEFVQELPLNGRTFQALIALTPGVITTPASFETQGQFSVNGQRTSSNYFTIDGVSANFAISSAVRPQQTAAGALPALSVAGTTAALLPVEAIQEFRIQTSAYAAEYGRQPGAQVQITSQSGGNAFHGTIFNFFRNDKLDATDWFANRNNLDKPPLRQNNFGGVLGGPIIPDRTFFLVTYEGLFLRQPKAVTVAVPNLQTRSQVPEVLSPFVNAIALPNGAELGNGTAEFSASYSDPTTLHATSLKVDHTVGPRLAMFGRYNYSRSRLGTRMTAPFAPNTVQRERYRIGTVTLGATAFLSPQWTSDTRFNVSWMSAGTREEVDSFGGAVPVGEDVLYPSFTSRDEAAYFLRIDGAGGFVDGTISHNRQKQFNWVQGVSWATPNHVVRFGADFRWMLPSVFTRNFDLSYRFPSTASLISGIASTAAVRAFPIVDYGFSNYSLFAQDQYRLTPDLTLTYGLRWEVNPGPTGRNGFDLFPIVGTFPNFSVGPTNASFYETTKSNFAPRVGLAWNARERTGLDLVIRTGFGVFHDLGVGLGGSLSDNLRAPSKSFANSAFPLPASELQILPLPETPPYTIATGIDPNLKLPYSLHWNLNGEQSFGANQSLSIGYVGSAGRRQLQTQLFLNPNSDFRQLRFIRNAADSSYHALQTRFQKRMGQGFQGLVSYTWSHSIDNTSGDDTVFSPPLILDKNLDRGDSDFDVRHVFTVGFTWEPRVTGSTGVLSQVVNGWGIDTIWRYQGALPVTPFESRVYPGLVGAVRTRPDLVSGVPLYLESDTLAGGRALNPAAFRRVTEARQGTLARNALRAFSLHQTDLSIRRSFAITERFQFQVRAEAYNVFNHPNFAAPVLDVASGLFGTSQQSYGAGLGTGGINGGVSPLYQVGTPRSLQLAMKVRF